MKLVKYSNDEFVDIDKITGIQLHKKEMSLYFGAQSVIVKGVYFERLIDEILNNDELAGFQNYVSSLVGGNDE